MTDSTFVAKMRLDVSWLIKASFAIIFLINASSNLTFSAVTASASNILVVTEPVSKLAVFSLSTIADLITALSIKVSPVMWVSLPSNRLWPLAPRLIPEMISPAELMFWTAHEPANCLWTVFRPSFLDTSTWNSWLVIAMRATLSAIPFSVLPRIRS